jgi:hypothetical protein
VDGKKRGCLDAYQSPDGIHWKLMAPAVITAGAFDSQNIGFWDSARGEYRAYWRIFTSGYTDERGWKPEGVRAIRTATSTDFVHWKNQADLVYPGAPAEHLYTNAVRPYFRAPQLLIGFPTRFQPKNEQVEPLFMSSRDGVSFRRWPEALIPITAPKDRDGNRSNYMTRGLLELPGHPGELSVYATEAYYKGPGSRLRRFAFRTDGFVSLHAEAAGELVTKPLKLAGHELELNCRTSKGGVIRVEARALDGTPLPGFALNDCEPVAGDEIKKIIRWKKGGDISAWTGRPIRLRFEVRAADLYSFKCN